MQEGYKLRGFQRDGLWRCLVFDVQANISKEQCLSFQDIPSEI
jgi:hypothetical protein